MWSSIARRVALGVGSTAQRGRSRLLPAALAVSGATAGFCACEPLELVQIGDGWEWRAKKHSRPSEPEGTAGSAPVPPATDMRPIVMTKPVTVVDTPGITIKEFFGNGMP